MSWRVTLIALLGLLALAVWLMGEGDGIRVAEKGLSGTASASSSAPTVKPASRQMPQELAALGYARIIPGEVTITSKITEQDVQAWHTAQSSEHPLEALKLLAKSGNALAANDVGSQLTGCIGSMQIQTSVHRHYLREKQKNAYMYLDMLQAGPASAASVASAEQRITELAGQIDHVSQSLEFCSRLSDDPWSGFDWFDRSFEMGNLGAGRAFVRSVLEAFRRPGIVARDPQRAREYRTRALQQLDRMLAQCNRVNLEFYAMALARLQRLSAYQRYVLAIVRTSSDVYDNLPSVRRAIRQAIHFQALEQTLTEAQRQAARDAAQRMRTRCLDS